MAIQFPNYDPDALYPRMDLPRTLDQVFSAYLQNKKMSMEQEQLAKAQKRQQSEDLLKFGFPLEAATPEAMSRLQGAPGTTPPASGPWDAPMQEYLAGRRKTQELEAQKRQAEIDKLSRTGGKSDEEFTQETRVRQEFAGLPAVKEYSTVRDAFSRIQSVGKKASAAGDLALIFGYMKILDPGSTVREGEFANAQNAGGVPDKVIAAYNKVARGERLSDRQRADFLNRSNDLFSSQRRIYEKTAEQYKSLSGRLGLSPENIIMDIGSMEPIVAEQKSPEQRYDELIKSGKTKEQAFAQMKEEGY